MKCEIINKKEISENNWEFEIKFKGVNIYIILEELENYLRENYDLGDIFEMNINYEYLYCENNINNMKIKFKLIRYKL